MALFPPSSCLSNIALVYTPHSLCPFVCPCTLKLLPCLGYCTQCCHDFWSAGVFKNFAFFLDLLLGIGFLGHWVLLCLVFKRTSIMFYLMDVPIYIHTNSVGGFLSFHTLCRIYCCRFLMWPFWPMWGDTSWYTWCAFLKELVMLSIFSCAFITVSMTSFRETCI